MVNDTSIIYGIILIFVMLGVIIPLVNEAFGVNEISSIEVENLINNPDENVYQNSTHVCNTVPLGVWGVFGFTDTNCYELEPGQTVKHINLNWASYLFSIGTMFFWSFGAIYWVLDLFILLPLRLLLAWLLYRALRSGGG